MKYDTIPLKTVMHTNYGDHPYPELNLHQPLVVPPTISVPYNYNSGTQVTETEEILGKLLFYNS